MKVNQDLVRSGQFGDAEWAKSLLAANADPNIQLGSGWGALHAVMISSCPDHPQFLDNPIPFVQVLLGARADINVKDAAGRTPLVFAAKSGRPELVELFQGAKELAEPGVVSSLGRAFKEGHASVAEALLHMGHHHGEHHLGVPIQQARHIMKDKKMEKAHPEARRLLAYEDKEAPAAPALKTPPVASLAAEL